MPITNTLQTAKRLEELGFAHLQAQGLSEILEGVAQDTNRDLKEFIRIELGALEDRLDSRMQSAMRAQMIWMFGMLVGLLGVTIAILKLVP